MHRRTPFRFSIGRGLLLLLTAAFVRAQAPVDVRPAIEIGSYQVSHYLVRKYYGRYASGVAQGQHRAVSPAEAQAWLNQYVASQSLAADLAARGLFDSPEVRRAVETMEQHMLTQPDGPFYTELMARYPAPDEAALRRRYIEGSRPTDCLVIAFTDEAARDRFVGADFSQAPRDEQIRRVHAVQARPDVRFFEGTVQWPFEPFPEIGDRLMAAREDIWEQFSEPDFGAYLVLKRHAGSPSRQDFDSSRAAFARHTAFVDKQVFVHRRHVALLRTAKFKLSDSTAAKLGTVLAKLDTPSELIPLAALPSEPLYGIELEAQPVEVPVSAWAERLNEQFIRHVPRSAAEVRVTAEDDAVRQLDLRAARALGVDRAPQFVEDRKGYLALQALDAYESRELVPTIKISDAELQAYYDAHRGKFVQTLRVAGRIIVFSDQEKAQAWMRLHGAPPVEGAENLTVSRGQVPPGFEPHEQAIFGAPPGFVIGPVARGDRFYCFQKTADVERGTASLEQVRDTVRTAVLRSALDQRERQIAAQLATIRLPKVMINADELVAGSSFAGKAGGP